MSFVLNQSSILNESVAYIILHIATEENTIENSDMHLDVNKKAHVNNFEGKISCTIL